MRKANLFLLDLALIIAASVFAICLRHNFELPDGWLDRSASFLIATAFVGSLAVLASGAYKGIWRYSGLSDYLRAVIVAGFVTAGVLGAVFLYDRLTGMPRALPALQFICISLALVASRVLVRLRHSLRRRRQKLMPLQNVAAEVPRNILVLGINDLAELYLRAVTPSRRIRIVGLLGRSDRHVRRRILDFEVLGIPEALEQVLRGLEVHGVAVDEIVVTAPRAELPNEAQAALAQAASARGIRVSDLRTTLGMDDDPEGVDPLIDDEADRHQPVASGSSPGHSVFQIGPRQLSAISARRFWSGKRFFDLIAASILFVALLPVMLLVALIVAVDVGLPVVFWQRRPGLGGRPFSLLKFRTMRTSRGADGARLPDADRLSPIGRFLRRSRLDELPQLLNILAGDMSFVGPRPLLPIDQPSQYRARLLVRPGLTGWAQVIGGRAISADDKAALDVWYVLHASMLLDLSIMIRTIAVVIRGERVEAAVIRRAWHDLQSSGTAPGRFVPSGTSLAA